MKSIREHMMFILPLMSILLGIEFFLVFDRVTTNYEEKLKANYSILVVTKKQMDEAKFKKIDSRIADAKRIERKKIAKDIAQGLGNTTGRDILNALPYFYSLHLNNYLDSEDTAEIEKKLLKDPWVKRVETFGESHSSKYNLFIFIKMLFWSFVALMSIVSLFLIVKQMEVWQMAHKERMRIMEIFGAPMLLRSAVLFRMGIVYAIVSALMTTIVFLSLKFYWADRSGIELLKERRDLLFESSDLLILISISLSIVIVAVMSVAIKSREVKE